MFIGQWFFAFEFGLFCLVAFIFATRFFFQRTMQALAQTGFELRRIGIQFFQNLPRLLVEEFAAGPGGLAAGAAL
jgi:hypothetical protein